MLLSTLFIIHFFIVPLFCEDVRVHIYFGVLISVLSRVEAHIPGWCRASLHMECRACVPRAVMDPNLIRGNQHIVGYGSSNELSKATRSRHHY